MFQKRSQLRFVAVAAFTILGIAGPVLAEQSPKVKRASPPLVVGDDGRTVAADGRLAPSAAPAGVAVPNDTCSGAIPLTVDRVTKGTTVGAADDYQTPATTACYQGIGQTPTTAPGRDVVYSFTAPADGSYAFSVVQQSPTDDIANQNPVLYVSDSCPSGGVVACEMGSNRPTTRAFVSATGTSNNQSEEVGCFTMTAGQVKYVFFDDGRSAATNGNNGGPHSLEARACPTESEPNNTPATATPFACGIGGVSDVAPVAHCYLGFRAGNVCTRSTPLDQSLPESNTKCSISANPCSWDTTSGVDTCPPGEGHCEQLADLDCDPHCTGGPNDGKVCATNAFCNPGSAQNATCSGSCQIEPTCIVTATGADTGTPCTPLCVGGTFDGRYCSALSDCTGGGGVCTANAGCAAGQACGRQYNEGDEDFFSLGTIGVGDKIFAAVDAKAANDYDWRMRITTTTDTLQFDDDDGISRNGSAAPEIAGAPGTGTATFVKISRSVARQSEPYHLYSIVRPPLASAQIEDESGPVGNDIYFGWPGDVLSANYTTAGGYVRGLFNGTHGGFAFDSDCFKFLVHEGDLMSWYGDGEPARSAAANTQHPLPIIYDADAAGISNFIFGANARKNTLTANATLNGLTPAVTSTFVQWRASYTGMLEVCYYDAAVPLGLGTPGNGAWAGSLDVNCGPLQPAGPGTTTTDVSVDKTILSGNGQTGTFLTYQIVVTNSAADIAQEVHLHDVLDPSLSFVSLGLVQPNDNTTCLTTDGFSFLNGVPTPGTADVPIDCITASMAPGDQVVYTVTVQVNNCIGAGIDIINTATITTVSTDPDPSNDSSTVTITTTEDGTCNALSCDASQCVLDLCQTPGTCNAGLCETAFVNCDDASVCTQDLCDPAIGCVNDPTTIGDACEDFNACTTNACDPVVGCVFPPMPDGTPCDDGLNCTSADHCDVNGSCIGANICDDGLPCTDDFADEGNGCACSYAPAFPGTPCDDGNPCTGNPSLPDSCDGANACTGGGPANCDDGNPCTSDACDPASGCTHAPLNCDDGSVCNGSETCDPAIGCVFGTPLNCSDGNPCNGSETCDPVSGCGAGTPLVCDDGNVCNGTETCAPASGCVAGTPLTCSDGNACNGAETCVPATGCAAGTPVVCTALDQCHAVGTCAPATGLCSNPNQPNGTACNDLNGCTTNDACSGGACVGGPAPVCNDGDICTADACTSLSGCTTRTIDFDVTGFSASRVDGRDLVVLADAWNSCPGDARYNAAADLDQGTSSPANCVDLSDFHLFMNSFGQACP